MKQCSRCLIEKPLTDFRKGKGYADGYRGQCADCLKELSREYKQRPDVQQQRRDYDQEYNARHEVIEHRRAWERQNNQRPEVKARVREYVNRPEVREHMKNRERQRWANDPKLREYKRAYLRKRYHTNPEHKRKQLEYSMAAIHARRVKLKKNGGSYTAKQWRELKAYYGHVCLCCGEAKPLTPDHIVPVDKGGSGDISNIQPLCLPCNLRKATKTIDYRPPS